MKAKTWDPWIGKNYAQGGIFKDKILILGESHYGDESIANRRDYTQQIVKEKIGEGTDDGKVYTSRFFTNIFYTFQSKENSVENLKAFWHSVAFYNYVQKPLSSARKKPEQWMWKDSKESFINVVSDLKPKYIIVLGYRMWGEIWQKFDHEVLKLTKENNWRNVHRLTKLPNQPIMFCIKHPSSGFSSEKFGEFADKIMEEF